MKFSTQLSFLALPVLLALGGCARSPAGGPVNPTAPNRLIVTARTQAPINETYYYAFAFDDDGNSATGPAALVSSSPLPNGVVGGSFTAIVIYHAAQYTVFRRTAGADNSTEQLERVPAAFVVPPTPASGNTLAFTLDLDATTESGQRLFNILTATNPTGVERLDVNFVTTNRLQVDPNLNLRKAYDAFGSRLPNFYTTLDIRGTRIYTNADTVQEPSNDVQTDETDNTINLDQLDLADFSISIERQ